MRIHPKKIMCAIDFSDFTDMILTYGKALADEFDADLCLCHVTSSPFVVAGYISPYANYAKVEEEHQQYAAQKLEGYKKDLNIACEVLVSSGYPSDEITRLAMENNVDMVIAATYGTSGIKRFFTGSVTDLLVKTLPCPLLVLNPSRQDLTPMRYEKIQLNKILLGCDFSRDSMHAFNYAIGLAQEFQSELHLVHVLKPMEPASTGAPHHVSGLYSDYPSWDMGDYRKLMKDKKEWADQQEKILFERLETQLQDMLPEDCRNWCTPITALLKGVPYEELVAYAQDNEIDVMVLGIHGHNFFDKFLVGSTTDRVISRTTCPVLTVRKLTESREDEEAAAAGKASEGVPEEGSDEHVTTAADIMNTNVIKVHPDTDIVSAAKTLLDNQINGVPVVDDQDMILGILCQSDLIYQQKEIPLPPMFSMLDGIIPLGSAKQMDEQMQKIAAINVEQAMVKNPSVVRRETPVSEIAGLMVEKHFHTIPVVEEGKLVGVIGKEDVLKVLVPA